MTESNKKTKSALKLELLSHGTLESRDLEASRKFYEDFFGFDVIRTSNISLMIRLGSRHVYVVVENKRVDHKMSFLNHNGMDVLTEAEVDEALSAKNRRALAKECGEDERRGLALSFADID